MSALLASLVLLAALVIDRVCGEPAPRWHPVVWMGAYLDWAGARLQRRLHPDGAPDYRAFVLGALYWALGALVFGVAAFVLQQLVWQLADWLAGRLGNVSGAYLGAAATVLLLGLLLKPMLAWAMLKRQVRATECALAQSLDLARCQLQWLVSRERSSLSATEVRESAIESLAENLSDSVVAPLFWFVLLGLPGAVVYRFANTADAMWGYPGVYQGKNWAWAGKAAAHLDDAMNWWPARLTGCLLACCAGVPWAALRREAGKTPSPNGGWPMAALALALGVRLGKRGVYVLNPQGELVQAGHTGLAIARCSTALLLFVVLALAALGLKALLLA